MKYKIAIVSGGDSGEYPVSVKGAAVVYAEMDKTKYEPFIIHMKGDEWDYVANDEVRVKVDKNDFSISLNGEKLLFDAVFVMIHGTPGEDGRLQGYFDLLRLPYSSCDHVTSAITFNKGFCNMIVSSLGVKIAKSVHLFSFSEKSVEIITSDLVLPVFVKPNLGGSSVGISKVKDVKLLNDALISAFNESPEVLVEEFIEGVEVTCGVIKYKGDIITFPITEIVSQNEFFDYEAKYLGKSQEITPAGISDVLTRKCSELSAMIYDKLNCKGVVRIDYIIKNNEFYFLEINTVPGMTAQSIVPQQAAAYGVSLQELISMIIESCLEGAGK